jgi:hypothetical protein
VFYDWATATLMDQTLGTTVTILPKDCSKSSAWKQVSANLTGGHQYALTLVSHDDDYAGDPTYALFDDVVVASTTLAPSAPASTVPAIVNGDFETGSLAP